MPSLRIRRFLSSFSSKHSFRTPILYSSIHCRAKAFSRTVAKISIIAPCLTLSGWAHASSLDVPTSDADGDFTIQWGTVVTYAYLYEQVNGGVWEKIHTAGMYGANALDLTRPEGTYKYKMEFCAVGSYGSVSCQTTSPSTLIISFPSNEPVEPEEVRIEPRATTYQTFYYDELGRLTKVEDDVSGNRNYDYDRAGNRTNVAVDPKNVTIE